VAANFNLVRRRILLPALTNSQVATGIFPRVFPADSQPPDRLMIMMAPPTWSTDLQLLAPYMLNGEIIVPINSLSAGPLTVNVFFWLPHTIDGPVFADPYTGAGKDPVTPPG
jgi:hypothetical protein